MNAFIVSAISCLLLAGQALGGAGGAISGGILRGGSGGGSSVSSGILRGAPRAGGVSAPEPAVRAPSFGVRGFSGTLSGRAASVMLHTPRSSTGMLNESLVDATGASRGTISIENGVGYFRNASGTVIARLRHGEGRIEFEYPDGRYAGHAQQSGDTLYFWRRGSSSVFQDGDPFFPEPSSRTTATQSRGSSQRSTRSDSWTPNQMFGGTDSNQRGDEPTDIDFQNARQEELRRKAEVERDRSERQRQYEADRIVRQAQYERDRLERQRQYEQDRLARQAEYERQRLERQRWYKAERIARQAAYEQQRITRQRLYQSAASYQVYRSGNAIVWVPVPSP